MARPLAVSRLIAGFFALGLMAANAHAALDCAAGQPEGIYQVVALRNTSDVMSTLATVENYAPAVQEVDFGGTSITWIDGDACLQGWSLTELEFAPVWAEDPLLSDVMAGPAEGAADHRKLRGWQLSCGAREMGSFAMVDARLLVAASPSGAVNVVLEKPLDPEDASALNSALAASGAATGTGGQVDAATRDALAHQAETLGAAYRFETTAIGLNLLEAVGVPCSE